MWVNLENVPVCVHKFCFLFLIFQTKSYAAKSMYYVVSSEIPVEFAVNKSATLSLNNKWDIKCKSLHTLGFLVKNQTRFYELRLSCSFWFLFLNFLQYFWQSLTISFTRKENKLKNKKGQNIAEIVLTLTDILYRML